MKSLRTAARKATALVATIAGLTAFAAPAAAAVLTVNADGILTGATGVNVGGTLYDVTFATGSCVDLFDGCDEQSDFDFSDQATATLAAQALLDQVFIDGAAGNFDSDPTLIMGCENATFDCDTAIVFGLTFLPSGQSFRTSMIAVNDGTVDLDKAIFQDGGSVTGDFSAAGVTFASFTAQDVAPVPLPAGFWLMGAGLAAGWTARKKRAAA